MDGWECRLFATWGDRYFHVFKFPNTTLRVAFIAEDDLCQFLNVKNAFWRKLIGRAINYHHITPEALSFLGSSADTDMISITSNIGYSIMTKSDPVLYRWEAFAAVLDVPGLLNRRYQVKCRFIMKRLYEKQYPGRDFEHRHETEEEWRERVNANYQQQQKRGQQFIARIERKVPGWNDAMHRVGNVAMQVDDNIMSAYDAAPEEIVVGPRHSVPV